MNISKLTLKNYRNYGDFSIEFSSNLNIFIGPNGIGKSNLVEAIYLVQTTTSNRTRENKNLVNWQSNFAKINISGKDFSLELRIINTNNYKKEIYINEIKKNLKDVLGIQPVVLFSVEQMELICGAAAKKRKYFNIIESQFNKKYLENIIELEKIIRQKNRLLFNIFSGASQKQELDFWNERLANIALGITQDRSKIINYFNARISAYYQKISGKNKDKLTIKYSPKTPKGNIFCFLTDNINREIKEKTTLFGPHRDEYQILLNSQRISGIVSRGELRSILLAIKFTEIDYLEGKTAKNVLLLLDDVFSELDQERKKHLTDLIKNHQVVITAVNTNDIDQTLLKDAQIIDLVKAKNVE